MRLIPNRRHRRRPGKVARIAISQAEITADLHYPAGRASSRVSAVRSRGGGR